MLAHTCMAQDIVGPPAAGAAVAAGVTAEAKQLVWLQKHVKTSAKQLVWLQTYMKT